jgi:hypothetical protein
MRIAGQNSLALMPIRGWLLDEVADHKCDTAPRLEQEPNDIAELVACELPRSVFVF